MTNTNEHGVGLNKIEAGDHLKVAGVSYNCSLHWGIALEASDPGWWYVKVHNVDLPNAEGFEDSNGNLCYLAAPSEIREHTPKDAVVLPEDSPEALAAHNVPTKTLTVHDDIQAALDFLHATTQRKWKATTKDVCLEVDGTTTYAGSITISFTEDK